MYLFNSIRIFPYLWFFEELGYTSKSAALVLTGEFNLPEIHWEPSHSWYNPGHKILKNFGDSFTEVKGASWERFPP